MMEKRMKNSLFACLLLATGSAALSAQNNGQTSPYAGTSNPPQDDILVTTGAQPIPKPSAGHPLVQQQQQQQTQPAPTRYRQNTAPPAAAPAYEDSDGSIVQATPQSSYQDPESTPYQPTQKSNRYDPAPANRTQQTPQASRYQSTQPDPYYQDTPASQPAQSSPAQPVRRSQSAQTDSNYQQAPTKLYRPSQNGQSASGSYQPMANDPYYQQTPDAAYQPSQTIHSVVQPANTYVQPAQSNANSQGQQTGTTYPSGQYDPYYQGAQANQYAQQPNSNGDSRYQANQPALAHRTDSTYDPDGDYVHAVALGPNQIAEGTTIHVHLLGRISSADATSGQPFRTRVVRDVVQGGQLMIPAGSEIEGRIYDISRGHVGSGGYLHLRPETVILRDGTRFKLYAQVTAAPGTNAQVGTEGTIKAGSRLKRNSIEYGSAVGVGAGTGAYMGGPVGALAGAAIGAGVITVHLMASHAQATLESGTPLQFTLTQRLSLVPTPYGE